MSQQPQSTPPTSSPGQEPSRPQEKSEPIDIKTLSIGDVMHGIKRLKVSSALYLVGSFAAMISLVWTIALSRAGPTEQDLQNRELVAAQNRFHDEEFPIRFIDRGVLMALVTDVLDEEPDGLLTVEEGIASLLWQVKSQSGFAEFLCGDRSISVQVTFAQDSINFEWTRQDNVVHKILRNIGLAPDEATITQLNSELNILGAAWIDDDQYIVRGHDGGLALIAPNSAD